MSLAGPALTACLLLLLAGTAKVHRPADTARALAPLVPGLPAGAARLAVRVLAGGELALGTAAVVWPTRGTLAAVAASYLAFAAVVVVVRRRGGPLASCGCFGTPDTPATALHVVVDVAAAAAAAVVAADGPPERPFGLLAGGPLHGVPLAAAATLAAWLVVAALAPAARLVAARLLLAPGTPGAPGDRGAQP